MTAPNEVMTTVDHARPNADAVADSQKVPTTDDRYDVVLNQIQALGTRPYELARELDAIVGERLCDTQDHAGVGRQRLEDVIATARGQARRWVNEAASLNRELDRIEAHFDGREVQS
jgi:hypothetical protein